MSSLPTGTVTHLFTDLEGSTSLWQQHPEPMKRAVARHDALLREAIAACEGHLVKSTGDGVHAVFTHAHSAVAAALMAQRALMAGAWEPAPPLRVRMGLHTGAAELRDGDYYGSSVNRAARLMSVAHGGQVVLSLATEELARDHLPLGVELRDLGQHRLKDLARPEIVFQLLHPDLPCDFPPLKSLDSRPNNLPAQLTSFIGRESEMAAVRARLTGTRLLTLTGSGGCGKSRLALQVAADVLDEHPDGVWLVELASLPDADLVSQAVASALGIREEPGRPLLTSLTDALKRKKLLLLLDNCEHLLTACARLADSLLRSCPQVTILASSREALGIEGETAYRVPSLALPDPTQALPPSSLCQYDAVRLFIERAVAVQPTFAVTNENAPALARVCHRLDGIPLAIELAAARVRMMPLEQIAKRLDDRFRFLTGGSRTALPRQQTLRGLIDWSYDLLSEPERALLRRLSVFAGGWTLEAAEAVCAATPGPATPSPLLQSSQRPISEARAETTPPRGERGSIATTARSVFPPPLGRRAREGVVGAEGEVLDLLTSLLDKSLVVYEEERGRYRLLETVRQYGRERLLGAEEAGPVRDRHADFFLRLAETAEPRLRTAEQDLWFEVLTADHDNLHAALEHLLERDHDLALRLVAALSRSWVWWGQLNEAREWLSRALSNPTSLAGTAIQARALMAHASIDYLMGELDQAFPLLKEALAIARQVNDKALVAEALYYLSSLMGADAPETSFEGIEEALALSQELGDPWLMGFSLLSRGLVAYLQEDYPSEIGYLEQSLTHFRQTGNGIVTNDKFCMSRNARLVYRKAWARPRWLRRSADGPETELPSAGEAHPSPREESPSAEPSMEKAPSGGTHETKLEGPAGGSRGHGR